MMYSNKQHFIYQLYSLISNSHVKYVIIAISCLLVFAGLFLSLYSGIDGKKKPSKKKIITGICLGAIGLVGLVGFFVSYKGLKAKVVDPQTIIQTAKTTTEKGKITNITSDGFSNTYQIKLDNHRTITINSNAQPVNKKQVKTYYPYAGTKLDQNLALTAKVGKAVKVVSPQYGYQFKNHNNFGAANQNKDLSNLNQAKINSLVVSANTKLGDKHDSKH